MASDQPAPENVKLRYKSASVYQRADTHSAEVGQLTTDDAFTVLGTEQEYYQVRLADGSVGFIYAQNLVGSNMPLTAVEQEQADTRAANAARPAGGWRGALNRLRGV